MSQGDPGDDRPVLRTGAPQGGIALHWLACIFYISMSSAISTVAEAIAFSGLLLTYAHSMVGGNLLRVPIHLYTC